MSDPKHEPNSKMDVRIPATGIIWGSSFLMITICMVPTRGSDGSLVALAVIFAACFGTVAVWNPWRLPSSIWPNAAQKRIAELEERLANLEVINNYECHLAQAALKKSAPQSSSAPAPDIKTE